MYRIMCLIYPIIYSADGAEHVGYLRYRSDALDSMLLRAKVKRSRGRWNKKGPFQLLRLKQSDWFDGYYIYLNCKWVFLPGGSDLQ
jgi:hypothetical protein